MIRAPALGFAFALSSADCNKETGRPQGAAKADRLIVGPDESGQTGLFEKYEPLDVAPMMIRAHIDILFGGRRP